MSFNADDAEIIRNGRTDEIGSICLVPKIRLVGADETFDEVIDKCDTPQKRYGRDLSHDFDQAPALDPCFE
ncbi:hypothetical protein NHJ13051_001810 [Beauveria bassiana]